MLVFFLYFAIHLINDKKGVERSEYVWEKIYV